MKIGTEEADAYWKSRPRGSAALPVLVALCAELQRQVPGEQMRALFYLAGGRVAAQHPMREVKTLAELQRRARLVLAELDLGWLKVEEGVGAVDFLHGAAPLGQWFGDSASAWAHGLLEGLYAEWMRQLGAGERLDVREVLEDGAEGGDVLRFRLAHESSFGAVPAA